MEVDHQLDHETAFHTYPPSDHEYYVQSPSNATTLHSPTRSDYTTLLNKNHPDDQEATRRITLSQYSYSRGSTNFYLHEKKISTGDVDEVFNGRRTLMVVDQHEHDGNDIYDYDYEKRRGLWWRYCSFRDSTNSLWIGLQISWRLLVSFGLALLVFYIATKPPSPHFSVKVASVSQFGLGEGIDRSGVATKILNCNASVHLVVLNKSKLFGLHVPPPLLQMSFGTLLFASSRGPKLYAESHYRSRFTMYVGTKSKPMYGAGRSMDDMLKSGHGLPILIRFSFTSNYRIVWSLINPKYHYRAQCLLRLYPSYDKKHRTQEFSSTCRFF